jgi:energy-coupling factor transporter ATP-binding protein EcfA2
METITLRRWDPSAMLARGPSAVLIVGDRGTGKTTLCRHLLELLDPSTGAPRERGLLVASGEWAGAFAPDSTHPEFSEDAVAALAALVAEQWARPFEERQRCSVVLDDVLHGASWQTGCVRQALMTNRTLRATVLVTTCTPVTVPPLLRPEFDYVFLMPDASPASRERLYRTFGIALPSLETFCSVFDEATWGRRCLVLDNTRTSARVEDGLFYYAAPEP